MTKKVIQKFSLKMLMNFVNNLIIIGIGRFNNQQKVISVQL